MKPGYVNKLIPVEEADPIQREVKRSNKYAGRIYLPEGYIGKIVEVKVVKKNGASTASDAQEVTQESETELSETEIRLEEEHSWS